MKTDQLFLPASNLQLAQVCELDGAFLPELQLTHYSACLLLRPKGVTHGHNGPRTGGR